MKESNVNSQMKFSFNVQREQKGGRLCVYVCACTCVCQYMLINQHSLSLTLRPMIRLGE